jgi:hypothetical protein
MAEVAKTGTPSVSTPFPGKEHFIVGLLAGEAIAAADACFINTDGLVYKADGSAADAEARVAGFAMTPASQGEAVTLGHGIMFGYGPNVAGTPVAAGAQLFLSGTVDGGLADAASVGGTTPIAYAVGDGRIYARGNWS